RLSFTAIGSKIDFHDYSHDWKLAPQGDVRKFDRGYNLSVVWTHTLSANSFYNADLSYFYKGFKEHLYENPFDPNYIIDPSSVEQFQKGAYEFNHGGTNLHRFERRTETRVGKIDYTNQVSKLHEIKAGLEGKLHRLYLEDYSLIPLQTTGGSYVPAIPADTTAEYEQYTEKPVEFSAYIQDKLEYERMIVNIGFRYDYFNSKGNVLADPYDPNVYNPQKEENKALTLDQRLQKWYKKASAKSLFSPRFGISYPITDRGILHFSYGHFLQIPSFIHLYQKPWYKVTTASGTQGVYGNPDLNAQKTVMYEFGLQQQISDHLSFDLTGFYRDTRDWVTTSPQIPVRDSTGQTSTSYYTIYKNQDYANSRGLTLTIDKRTANLWSLNLSYTIQIAEGVNSNPDDAYRGFLDNKEPARSLTPLDWDQVHTANLTLGIGENDWGVFFLGRFGSGLPYTPVINQADQRGQDVARGVQSNSRRRPENYSVDVRLFKNFKLAPVSFSAFIKIFNLLDRRNEITVYGETGRATATPENLGAGNISPQGRINSIASYLNRPDFYSEPREIQFGIEAEF
ncbi:MAG TPA: TonB-dependent receptor, partial [Bacteroidota bacterium]|nr:TonB-dependent receptor [Bacteroidota bacterium]